MQAVVCAENQTDYPQAPVTFAGSAEISTGPEPARPTAPADFRKLEENSIASSQIAYTAEQQYFSTEQEVSKQKQGFRLAKPKSLPDEVFGIHNLFIWRVSAVDEPPGRGDQGGVELWSGFVNDTQRAPFVCEVAKCAFDKKL